MEKGTGRLLTPRPLSLGCLNLFLAYWWIIPLHIYYNRWVVYGKLNGTLIDDLCFVFTYYVLCFPGIGVSPGPIIHARVYKLPTWLF